MRLTHVEKEEEDNDDDDADEGDHGEWSLSRRRLDRELKVPEDDSSGLSRSL
jgi:hypothetical protein